MMRSFAILAIFTLISSVLSAMLDLQGLRDSSLMLEGDLVAGSAANNSSGISGAALTGQGSVLSTSSVGQAAAGAVSTPTM